MEEIICYANIEELRRRVVELGGVLCLYFDKKKEREDYIGTVEIVSLEGGDEERFTHLGNCGRILRDGRVMLQRVSDTIELRMKRATALRMDKLIGSDDYDALLNRLMDTWEKENILIPA